ncbi:MAG TPA: hypothetical protein VK735_40205 [Pseudonocardia sp.]|uniref:hypothetical protein n=1 Tax=Pseudonocardia sp. TaxID=60912 RepID=UPI002C3CEEA6|nr:hypothetical protein [Pseudonocardia sp.]HTF53709.1 hypothetical protein [Pseudonocardia sp.]
MIPDDDDDVETFATRAQAIAFAVANADPGASMTICSNEAGNCPDGGPCPMCATIDWRPGMTTDDVHQLLAAHLA